MKARRLVSRVLTLELKMVFGIFVLSSQQNCIDFYVESF